MWSFHFMLKSIVAILLVLGGAVAVIALLGSRLPVKHTATRTAAFRQTPQQVWDVIAGPPTWRPEIQKFEILPSDDGKRKWIEYGSHGQKITYEAVESVSPQKLITCIADPHLPFGGSWTYEIAPASDGSTLTITENGEVYNPTFRFVSRYVQGYTATIDAYLKALHSKLDAS
jgi:hypothetical protein